MAYLVRYENQKGTRCARVISRGFACTQAELPREIQTRCRAVRVIEWSHIADHPDAKAAHLEALREMGWHIESDV